MQALKTVKGRVTTADIFTAATKMILPASPNFQKSYLIFTPNNITAENG
jgi:hypothetical protein